MLTEKEFEKHLNILHGWNWGGFYSHLAGHRSPLNGYTNPHIQDSFAELLYLYVNSRRMRNIALLMYDNSSASLASAFIRRCYKDIEERRLNVYPISYSKYFTIGGTPQCLWDHSRTKEILPQVQYILSLDEDCSMGSGPILFMHKYKEMIEHYNLCIRHFVIHASGWAASQGIHKNIILETLESWTYKHMCDIKIDTIVNEDIQLSNINESNINNEEGIGVENKQNKICKNVSI